MAEPIVTTDRQEVDEGFLSRLLLGAQTEHEQRLVAVRLLHRDADFRAAVAEVLAPFEMFDLDLLAEYDRVLRRDAEDERVASRRRQLLTLAFERAPDLENMIRNLTFVDLLQLGEVTRWFFSWSMAELLLQRVRRVGASEHEMRTSLYMALMVIDVVEILAAAGRCPEYPEVVRDVRQRIKEAWVQCLAPVWVRAQVLKGTSLWQLNFVCWL